MLDKKHLDVLRKIARFFGDFDWFVYGDLAKAVKGESVVPKSIELVINYRDIEEALESLSIFERSDVVEVVKEHCSEFTVVIDDVKVLVKAEYPEGPHSKGMSAPSFIDLDGLTIQCV